MNNLQQIQVWMKKKKIDLFIINRTDEFLSEYIAPYAERLKWISNFSGSAGRAVILQKKATIFVDGRYTLQAHREVDSGYFKIRNLIDYWNWLENNINYNNTIAVDISLHSSSEILRINSIIKKKQSKIEHMEKNPIDIFWKDQPLYPKSLAFIHHEKYAGSSTSVKLQLIQSTLISNYIDYYLLSSLDSIAWVLNIRGNDILYTPLILSFVIIPKKGKIEFFVNEKKILNIKNELKKIVNFHPFKNIRNYLSKIDKKNIVGLDESRSAYIFKKICNDKSIITKYLSDPCIYPKAQKNLTELNGAKNANLRDGVSITKFIYWLKNEIEISSTNEIMAAEYLNNLRKKNKLFFSPSFSTISAVGANSALPHYKLTNESNQSFSKNSIYLVDSGAQYHDGTTDITRTIILGKPTQEQKDRFTRVLKGHIAIATAEFPVNSKGSTLDPLARKSLLDIGCDYEHGTGHGIGSFLSVHEGPQRISKLRQISEDGILKEGMILSNEPGFYKAKKYGIRIENLIIVIKQSQNKLKFETISWAPIDTDLIDINLLTLKEVSWINYYHKKVFLNLNNKINTREKKWLAEVTKPIKK